jgi:hypothetical protein
MTNEIERVTIDGDEFDVYPVPDLTRYEAQLFDLFDAGELPDLSTWATLIGYQGLGRVDDALRSIPGGISNPEAFVALRAAMTTPAMNAAFDHIELQMDNHQKPKPTAAKPQWQKDGF